MLNIVLMFLNIDICGGMTVLLKTDHGLLGTVH